MNAKKRIMQFALMLMIAIIVSDFSYTAVQYAHNESTSFIIETDAELTQGKLVEEVVSGFRENFITLFSGKGVEAIQANSGGLVVSNISPHGWHVPVFLDDRVFII